MADTTTRNSNPIKDTNFNGVLDGKDLKQQLAAEEEQGNVRTANEKVHGVLEIADVRGLSERWNLMMLSGKITPDNLQSTKETMAGALNKRLENRLADFEERLKKDPDFLRKEEAYIRSANADEKDKDVLVADLKNFASFAANVRKDFPKGIKVDAEDVLDILGHFGTLMVPAPKRQDSPASGQRI